MKNWVPMLEQALAVEEALAARSEADSSGSQLVVRHVSDER
jgi:hypothetical protein